MTTRRSDVKPPSRQFADWLDKHPRTGWYVAAWASLMTLNQLYPLVDKFLT